MCIECYYKWCPHHSYNEDKEEGPYCYEEYCSATKEQIIKYNKLRVQELKMYETENIGLLV